MKLNIFHIPLAIVADLEAKLNNVGLEKIFYSTQSDWETEFYISKSPEPVEIPWATEFSHELASLSPTPVNTMYFGAYIWKSKKYCFALSFGKAHFYLREFCRAEFGLDMARRICNKADVRQKAARRYAGKRKKEIRSYQKDTELDIESGESVDYLQAATISSSQWGKSAKFGASMLVAPPIKHDDIAQFLSDIERKLDEPPLFDLPRTEQVRAQEKIAHYDQILVKAILAEDADFEIVGHQLIGVDFIFSGNQEYLFQRQRAKSPSLSRLDMSDLRAFIESSSIRPDEILEIKVKVIQEDAKAYSLELKKALEYSIETEKVFLQNGRWTKFNEDYADWLDRFLDEAIEIDLSMEQEFDEISSDEPTFNAGLDAKGYDVADKNFEIIKLKGYRVEAWDHKKGDTVYAVKFGKPKELGYVCDQASNTLDILRNDPAALNGARPKAYCLWMVFERVNRPGKLSEIRSIILKQKLDAWVRKCREMGIRPVVRISRRTA